MVRLGALTCLGAMLATASFTVAHSVHDLYMTYSRLLSSREEAVTEHLMELFKDFRYLSNEGIPPGLLKQLQPEPKTRVVLRWVLVGLTHMPSVLRPYDPLLAAEEVAENHGRVLGVALPKVMAPDEGGRWYDRYYNLLSEYERTFKDVEQDRRDGLGILKNVLLDRHRAILARLWELGDHWKQVLRLP